MITATFADNGKELSVQVDGHAGFAKLGKDIVCAAASSLGQALVCALGGVEGIDGEARISNGGLTVSCTATIQTRAMFSMCLAGFVMLSQKYPANVTARGEISLNG